MSDNDRTVRSPQRPGDDADLTDDPRVVEVVMEYLREREAGRTPDLQRYVNRYPELAGAVAQCIEGLELVQAGAPALQPLAAEVEPLRTAQAIGRDLPSPLGDFQIIGEIARGGMGIVYEAVQLSLGRRVALKVLPFAANVDPRYLQRFKIEAQAAALLHHMHIVPIHAVGCERGVHFYAMQLIEGQSLAMVVKQLRQQEGRGEVHSGFAPTHAGSRGDVESLHQPLRSTVNVAAAMTAGTRVASEAYIQRVARLMVQAADALEHAHQSGVVHRDIKPGNLLLDPNGNLWITDFGLAQLQADNGLTRSGDMLGTFRYMSPEQTGGLRTMLDHRTDIYSLGATFYELLTLEAVFSADSHQQLLFEILHTEPKSIRELNRAVPPELETVILKALSKNPAERYATAAEFKADIQRYLDNQPILARRPTLLERARKWTRRHPSVVIAGAVVLIVLALASLVSNRLIALEQAQTAAALDRERVRANEAETRFQQARRAVDALFQISEEELTDKPGEAARKRILELVLIYYQDFIDQRQGDPTAQAELAAVQAKVKGILRDLNVLQQEMPIRLLAIPEIQTALELSKEQQAKFQLLLQQWTRESQQFFSESRDLTGDQRHQRMVALASAHELALQQLLTPGQRQRLWQIDLQAQGWFAFKQPEVVKALQLTTDQRAQIRELERELFAHRMWSDGPGPGGPPPGGPEDGRRPPPHGGPPHDRVLVHVGPGPGPAFGGLGFGGPGPRRRDPEERERAEAWRTKVLAILTPAQQAEWKKLTGEPFQALGEFFGPPFGPPPPRD